MGVLEPRGWLASDRLACVADAGGATAMMTVWSLVAILALVVAAVALIFRVDSRPCGR